MNIPPSTTSIKDYKDMQEIGRGSFATVFKAFYNGTPVAIKTVNRQKLNRKLSENLEMEISILKSSKHRNVVELYQIIRSDAEIHMVMEFCSLGDLSLYIKRKGATSTSIAPMSPWGGLEEFSVRYLLAQLSSAIEFLRFNQIIHRDLKPQNILLTAPPPITANTQMSVTLEKISNLPLLKLGDFGFARALESQSMASTLCGSPLYMAPEILRGERYDAKTDLWSIGAIVFEMVTGKPPFRAQNHIELLRKIERGDGWVRFPDEAADQYRSSGFAQPRQFRKVSAPPQNTGLANVSSAPSTTNNAFRVGSLGVTSSPGLLKSPVPEDIKDLVRKLLKRNPVERMGFEEFFIHSCVVEARQLDSRILETSSQIVASGIGKSTSSASSGLKSPISSPVIQRIQNPIDKLNFGSTTNTSLAAAKPALSNDSLLAPFPNYGHDPNWSQKVIEKTGGQTISPQMTIKHTSDVSFQVKPPVLPEELKDKFEDSSIGSLGSIEFSSDEDKGDQNIIASSDKKDSSSPSFDLKNNNVEAARNSSGLGGSDEFVVVEKGQEVQVNWNPVSPDRPGNQPTGVIDNSSTQPRGTSPNQSTLNSVPVPISQTSWSRPFNPLHTISKALSSSLIYGSSPLSTGSPENAKLVNPPKARLFGSLRADNSFVNHSSSSHIPPLDQTKLLGSLPFQVDTSLLSPPNKSSIEQILLYIARAYCISSLADKYYQDFDLLRASATQPSTSQSIIVLERTLAVETLNLFVFSIGMYQYALNQAKHLWGLGPAITPEGYSFSSGEKPTDTQKEYLTVLSMLITFIQTQFDGYFEKADRLQSLVDEEKSKGRIAHRIIYETALSTCKKGALSELKESSEQEGYYKTALLLLFSLLQPSWDESEVLDEQDRRDLQGLVDQITIRLYKQ